MFVASQDFTVFGGSMGEVHAQKVTKVMDLAMSTGAPFVAINDSGGARIQEGAASLAGYGYIFERNVRASGVIPQISVIMGPCAGGAVYSPAITDFTFMVRETSHMFITGPDVIKTVTGEDISMEALGGAMTHATESGVASFIGEDDEDVLNRVRYLLSFLPSNNLEDPPAYAPTDDPGRVAEALTHIVPDRAKEPYDMHEVIRYVVDDGEFLEVFPLWAMSVVIGFARLDGKSVGVIANQPKVRGGTLDIDASEKASRFVRFCDAFNIPILTLVDGPASCRGRTGVQRHHPARGEAPVRLRGGDRAAHDRDHAQGLRGRLPRHELEAPARRRVVRLADRGDRGDGRRGRGQRRVPQGDREGRRP